MIHKYIYIFVIHENTDKAISYVALPGMVGGLTGLNKSGVIVGAVVAKSGDNSVVKGILSQLKIILSGTPLAIALRKVLEESKNSREAVELLMQKEFPSGWNILSGDKSGNFYVAERDAGIWGGSGCYYSTSATGFTGIFNPILDKGLFVTGDYVKNLPDIDYPLMGETFYLHPQTEWGYNYFSALNTFFTLKEIFQMSSLD